MAKKTQYVEAVPMRFPSFWVMMRLMNERWPGGVTVRYDKGEGSIMLVPRRRNLCKLLDHEQGTVAEILGDGSCPIEEFVGDLPVTQEEMDEHKLHEIDPADPVECPKQIINSYKE